MPKMQVLHRIAKWGVGELPLLLLLLTLIYCAGRTKAIPPVEVRAELIEVQQEGNPAAPGGERYFFTLKYVDPRDNVKTSCRLEVGQREWQLFRLNAEVCLTLNPTGITIHGCRA